MSSVIHKKRGFEGELLIEVPKQTIAQCQKLPLINSFFISRMGFFPKAMNHYFQRPSGISDAILIYCTGGSGWIQIHKNKMPMAAGSFYIIPAGMPHSYGADINNPWTIYWFHLYGSQCNESVTAILGEKSKMHKPILFSFSEKRDTIFKQISFTLLKGYSITNLLYANLLLKYYLASFIIPDHFQQDLTAIPVTSATDKAILFMQKNLSKKITLENIARSAHLSVSFFSKKFRQQTGYAPIEYFNHLRIQKACQLLHFSKLRINEIAFQLGIEDPLYFSRLFKQQMGVSPVAYRKNEDEHVQNNG